MNSAVISAASNGDNTLVAAPGAGKQIVVCALAVVVAGAVSVKFKSASTDKTGAMPFPANGGVALPFAREGWFECAPNEALVMNLSGAVQASGVVRYFVRGG